MLFGDKSVGPWLRHVDFGKIVIANNPLFSHELPLESIPVCARDVNVRWIMANCFYVITFRKGDGPPPLNLDLPHKGWRGGTMRSRYYGVMEGVTPATKGLPAKLLQALVSAFTNGLIVSYGNRPLWTSMERRKAGRHEQGYSFRHGPRCRRRLPLLDEGQRPSGLRFHPDRQFITRDTFHDLPVVAFENVEQRFPPDEHKMLVLLGYQRMNALRAEKYLAAKRKGYSFVSYVNSNFYRAEDLAVGENCFILDNQSISLDVKIGNNVVMWSSNHIGDMTIIGDHVWLASHVTIAAEVEVEFLLLHRNRCDDREQSDPRPGNLCRSKRLGRLQHRRGRRSCPRRIGIDRYRWSQLHAGHDGEGQAMKWTKLGRIYVPDGSLPWARAYAANPVAEQFDDKLFRIYFSTRDEQNRSSIGFVEIDIRNPSQFLRAPPIPVLAPGDLAMFDDSGASIGCIVPVGQRRYLYYMGWHLTVTVPWQNALGIAIAKAPINRLSGIRGFRRSSLTRPIPIRSRIRGFCRRTENSGCGTARISHGDRIKTTCVI